MATRNATLLAADDEADIVEVRCIRRRDRRPIAAKAIRIARAGIPSMRREGRTLPIWPATDRATSSSSATASIAERASIFYERDAESGEFALLDRSTREVRKLFTHRKALADVALRKMQPVIIPARDGLQLNGYLTMPAPDAGGKLPLVLLIHGGPYARDHLGFQFHPSMAGQSRLCGA